MLFRSLRILHSTGPWLLLLLLAFHVNWPSSLPFWTDLMEAKEWAFEWHGRKAPALARRTRLPMKCQVALHLLHQRSLLVRLHGEPNFAVVLPVVASRILGARVAQGIAAAALLLLLLLWHLLIRHLGRHLLRHLGRELVRKLLLRMRMTSIDGAWLLQNGLGLHGFHLALASAVVLLVAPLQDVRSLLVGHQQKVATSPSSRTGCFFLLFRLCLDSFVRALGWRCCCCWTMPQRCWHFFSAGTAGEGVTIYGAVGSFFRYC